MKEETSLTIRPEGEIHDWRFSSGSSCGAAKDSVGIVIGKYGCAIKRDDVRKLIAWLQSVEASWIEPQRCPNT